MSESEALGVRWSVEQRLIFIDRRLFWDGKINRSDLSGFFSVSTPQASADLAHYETVAPGNLTYDTHAKAYVSTSNFDSRFDHSAREYLAQLQLVADGVIEPGGSWIGWVPPYDVTPKVRRRLEADVLREILLAIRSKNGLHIEYQSMSKSEPSMRWIAPHAVCFDGNRWHVRAWCHRREKFLDFVLARVLSIRETRSDEVVDTRDQAWHRTTTLCLGPNPRLQKAQQRAIELDFGMRGGVIEVEVRRSLVYYLARQLLLDVAKHLPPERVQVVLMNAPEVNADLAEVGEAAIDVSFECSATKP